MTELETTTMVPDAHAECRQNCWPVPLLRPDKATSALEITSSPAQPSHIWLMVLRGTPVIGNPEARWRCPVLCRNNHRMTATRRGRWAPTATPDTQQTVPANSLKNRETVFRPKRPNAGLAPFIMKTIDRIEPNHVECSRAPLNTYVCRGRIPAPRRPVCAGNQRKHKSKREAVQSGSDSRGGKHAPRGK